MKRHISKLIALVFTFLALFQTSYAEEYGTIIFYGNLKHALTDSRNHEGNMELIGFSKEFNIDKYRLDTGFSSYLDSYHKRSYVVFSNISHQDYHYGIVTPMLEVGITNKGKDHDSSERKTYPFLIPKLRFGANEGLFVDLSSLPKIKGLTNGWLAIEIGYKY